MKRDKFIEKAIIKHGDKYGYDMIESKHIKEKQSIMCPIHGVFEQRGDAHLNGQGCSLCGGSKKKTSGEFIDKAVEIFGSKYDYSLVEYVNSKTKIKIVCSIHGIFEQTPDNHISGHGCSKCGSVSTGELQKKQASDDFINKAVKIFGEKYDYSMVKYVNAKTKIDVVCPIHGIFKQTPNDHLSKKSCLYCSTINTKPEIELKKMISELNVEFIENDREILNGSEIDIYLPSHKIGIEFNGLYWLSNKFKSPNYHNNKTNECNKNNIQLLHIFEDEWINKNEIVKSIIKSKLNLIDRKIYARKTIIKEITHKEAKNFLNENHIQGSINSLHKIGLYLNDELVSIMCFGKNRIALGGDICEGEFELLRFCNKVNTRVIGGASKMLNFFIKTYKPDKITTYADRRYSNGDLYKHLGFEYVKTTKPNYWYFKKNELIKYHRYGFRKHKLINQGFDKNKTEKEIMDERGFYHIYDSGNILFIRKF